MKQELIDNWQRRGYKFDKKLIEAFKAVPREKFVHDHQKEGAYIDIALPIGHSQTISQPFTVMTMTQALDLKPNDKVLEVGTGSGYQAAIIAKIIAPGKIFSTEIISELVIMAKNNLKKANIKNVKVINYDGSKGYPPEAPYDKIIVTAACPEIPKALIEQLKEGGILVAPVGSILFGQKMIKAKKVNGKLHKENLGMFVFVPLKGEFGYI